MLMTVVLGGATGAGCGQVTICGAVCTRSITWGWIT